MNSTAKALRSRYSDDLSCINPDQVRDAIRTQRNLSETIIGKAERAGRELLASEQRQFTAASAELVELDQLLDEVVVARTRQRADEQADKANRNREIAESRARVGIEINLMGGTDPRHSLGSWLARSLSGATGSGAAFAPAEQYRTPFEYLKASTIHGAMGVTTLLTRQHSLTVPSITAGAAVAWVAEGGTISPTDLTATTLTATPRKVAGLTVLSNEVIADSIPALLDVAARDLLGQVGRALDLAIFEGTGSANNQPTGLKSVSGISEIGLATNGAVPSDLATTKIADAIGTLQSDNANATALVLHPRTLSTLRKLVDSTGRPLLVSPMTPGSAIAGELFGVPVYVSSQLSITETQGTSTDCSSIYVVQADQIVLVMREDARVEVDRSRLFHTDQSEVRVIMRADVVVPNAKAICRIKGFRA